jgi:hypothetical protein
VQAGGSYQLHGLIKERRRTVSLGASRPRKHKLPSRLQLTTNSQMVRTGMATPDADVDKGPHGSFYSWLFSALKDPLKYLSLTSVLVSKFQGVQICITMIRLFTVLHRSASMLFQVHSTDRLIMIKFATVQALPNLVSCTKIRPAGLQAQCDQAHTIASNPRQSRQVLHKQSHIHEKILFSDNFGVCLDTISLISPNLGAAQRILAERLAGSRTYLRSEPSGNDSSIELK